jgi:hypothetical protein
MDVCKNAQNASVKSSLSSEEPTNVDAPTVVATRGR